MIAVEITASNLAFFEEFELTDRISYSELHEISLNMETGEFIKFALYEGTELFYQGTFEKLSIDQNVTDDIFSVLESYQKQKKISRKQKKEFQSKIKQALEESSKEQDSAVVQDSVSEQRSIRHQKAPTNFLYKIMILFIGTIAFLAIVFTGYSLFEQTSNTKIASGSNYEQLLKERQYIAAAEKYTEKQEAISVYLLNQVIQSKESVQQLEDYYEAIPSTYKELDLLLVNSEYAPAIKVYEKNPFSFDTKNEVRGNLIGYAYLKTEQLNKAEEINQQLNRPELEKEPLEHKDKIMELIDRLYDTKQELRLL